MISAALLEIARCPHTGQRLAFAGEATLAQVSTAWREGTLRLPAAVPQLDPDIRIDAVLVTEDGNGGYAVQGGIPILLPDHRIALRAEASDR